MAPRQTQPPKSRQASYRIAEARPLRKRAFNNDTTTHLALNHPDGLQILLEDAHLFPNFVNKENRTPFHPAALNGLLDPIEILLYHNTSQRARPSQCCHSFCI